MTSLDEIGPGDLVKISREVVVKEVCERSFVSEDGFRYYPKEIEHSPEVPVIRYKIELIEKADPQHWPPRGGDLWVAKGEEYFITMSWNSTLRKSEPTAIGSTDRNVHNLYGNIAAFKALRPTLKYRKVNG